MDSTWPMEEEEEWRLDVEDDSDDEDDEEFDSVNNICINANRVNVDSMMALTRILQGVANWYWNCEYNRPVSFDASLLCDDANENWFNFARGDKLENNFVDGDIAREGEEETFDDKDFVCLILIVNGCNCSLLSSLLLLLLISDFVAFGDASGENGLLRFGFNWRTFIAPAVAIIEQWWWSKLSAMVS